MTPPPARACRPSLTHRGPDEEGTHVDEWAALGHRRLSIIDLAAGHQPLSNEDGAIWISLQRRDLQPPRRPRRARGGRPSLPHEVRHRNHRSRLRAVGRRLRAAASAGMFAFAIWDVRRRRLLLARDRLGVKPLYWTLSGGRLFSRRRSRRSSKAGSLRAAAQRSRPPGTAQHAVPLRHRDDVQGHPASAARAIRSVFADGTVRIRRYWDVPVRRASRAERRR